MEFINKTVDESPINLQHFMRYLIVKIGLDDMQTFLGIDDRHIGVIMENIKKKAFDISRHSDQFPDKDEDFRKAEQEIKHYVLYEKLEVDEHNQTIGIIYGFEVKLEQLIKHIQEK